MIAVYQELRNTCHEPILFSDDEKFNLDGLNGYQYYWHCIKDANEFYLI